MLLRLIEGASIIGDCVLRAEVGWIYDHTVGYLEEQLRTQDA